MYITTVIDIRACMDACILDNILLNIGHLVISDLKFYKKHGGTHILLNSLITMFCKRASVMEYIDDT